MSFLLDESDLLVQQLLVSLVRGKDNRAGGSSMAKFSTTKASYCISTSAGLIKIPVLAISGNMTNFDDSCSNGGPLTDEETKLRLETFP